MTPYGPFENAMLTVLAGIVLIIFFGSLYAFVFAIIKFIFSQGDAEKIAAARNSIRYMIIGILLTILLLFLTPFFFEKMNVQGFQIYTASNIFLRAGELLKSIFTGLEGFQTYYRQGSASPVQQYESPPSDYRL